MSSENNNKIDDTLKNKIPELFAQFKNEYFTPQRTADDIVTLWITDKMLIAILSFMKSITEPFDMLYDLYAVDERLRLDKQKLPVSHFTLVYQLLSIKRNQFIRFKVALTETQLQAPSITHLFKNANWYEREAWDLFGITFSDHPLLTRILLPPTFKGHPLRKEFPCRATEKDPFSLDEQKLQKEQNALKFIPDLSL